MNQEISDMFSQEWTKKERTSLEKLAIEENTLHRALHGAIIRDVMELFPCVLFVISQSWNATQVLIYRSLERDRLSSHAPSHTNLSVGQEIAGKLSLRHTDSARVLAAFT